MRTRLKKLKRFDIFSHLTNRKGREADPLNKNKLIQKAKRGNHEAFIQLLQEEKIKLYKMAYIYVQNEADALDIVQETVTRAFKGIGQVKEAHYFSTWLMKICMNTSLELLRKSKKVTYLEQVEADERVTVPLDEKLDLLSAIAKLEEKYKTVILLRYYRDMQVSEIAEVLNCPEGTAKTNLHRAVQQLKKYFLKGGALYGEQY